MRDTRFRAWDEEEEYMFYSDKDEAHHFFEFKGNTLKGFAIRPPRPSSDPMEAPEPYTDDYPVMQFTGLHDKNGKEIWERDIVASETDRGVVFWHDRYAQFQIDNSITDKYVMPQDEWDNYEVIGNIYENPELLTEEKQ